MKNDYITEDIVPRYSSQYFLVLVILPQESHVYVHSNKYY